MFMHTIISILSVLATMLSIFNTHTHEPVTIININGEVVTVATTDGNSFSFYGDGYALGTSHIAIIDTLGTTDRTDDVVVNVL